MPIKGGDSPKISVIIPVINEGRRINKIIDHLNSVSDDFTIEIIVVDGCENKSTLSMIGDKKVKKISSPKGRGLQMNRGADGSTGDVLLFLHADTELPGEGFSIISRILKSAGYVGGAFSLSFDSRSFGIRLISFGAAIRYRLTNIPFGDQGIFIRKKYFYDIGCYEELPLMEDVELMKRIKKRGDKILISGKKVITSSRKWEKGGILYTTFRNWMIQILYQLGVSPRRLVRFYYKDL